MSETTDLLAKVPLLSSLDEKQLERLARDFSERTFPAGSVVVREATPMAWASSSSRTAKAP
jgi:hypothetical protein